MGKTRWGDLDALYLLEVFLGLNTILYQLHETVFLLGL